MGWPWQWQWLKESRFTWLDITVLETQCQCFIVVNDSHFTLLTVFCDDWLLLRREINFNSMNGHTLNRSDVSCLPNIPFISIIPWLFKWLRDAEVSLLVNSSLSPLLSRPLIVFNPRMIWSDLNLAPNGADDRCREGDVTDPLHPFLLFLLSLSVPPFSFHPEVEQVWMLFFLPNSINFFFLIQLS